MPDFLEYFKNWFRKAEKSSPSNPALHEVIKRSDEHRQKLQAWKHSLAQRRLTDWLWQQYAIWQTLPDDLDPAVDFLDTPSSKGFAIHFFQAEFPKEEAVLLFDYLKDKVLELPYRLTLADRRVYAVKSHMETVERYYLKPRQQRTEEQRIDQGFGNVTIELVFRDDIPHQLRFQATSYNDRLYAPAAEFKSLFQMLLSA